jgi:hypothetical protein
MRHRLIIDMMSGVERWRGGERKHRRHDGVVVVVEMVASPGNETRAVV